MIMLLPRLFAIAASLSVLAAPALAQNNVVLENLESRAQDQRLVLNIARVEVANTNLSREDISKLFSVSTPAVEASAIAARLKADRLVVRGAVLAGEEDRLSFGPLEIAGVEQGRFAKASLGGFTASFSGKPTGSITGRAVTMESGDLAPLIAALQVRKFGYTVIQIGRIVSEGFEGSFTDPDAPTASPGGNQIKIGLRAFNSATQFEKGVPIASRMEAVSLTVDPAPGSDFSKSLRAFGLERIEVGLTGQGRYDPVSRIFVLEDYSIASPAAGRLTFSGQLSGVDADALASLDAGRRGFALLGAGVDSLKIDFLNEGLVDKSFAYAAARQGKSPAALRAETSMMAAQLLPLLMGGDPQSLALAQALQTFLAAPKSFSMMLRARGSAVPLARLSAIRDPASFLALVEMNVRANP